MGVNETVDKLLSYIYNSVNNSSHTLAIFFDLKKAFDTVNQSILLLKLQRAGVRGKCLNLLTDYLNGRSHKCFVNNLLSSQQSVP